MMPGTAAQNDQTAVIKTSVVGAFPVPAYVGKVNWFTNPRDQEGSAEKIDAHVASIQNDSCCANTVSDGCSGDGGAANSNLNLLTVNLNLLRGLREIVETQCCGCGLDVVTDGEIQREDYIHYHLRHLEGVDFRKKTLVRHSREGQYVHWSPTITGRIQARKGEHFLVNDLRLAELFLKKNENKCPPPSFCVSSPATSDFPVVKMTLPGPMTILDTIANEFYTEERFPATAGEPDERFEQTDSRTGLVHVVVLPRWKKLLLSDLSAALNYEIQALVVEGGCREIQVDEPVWARYPEECIAYGVRFMEQCFAGATTGVLCRTVHICCGYPAVLDEDDNENNGYRKAPGCGSYFRIAPFLDRCTAFDAVSLEDAHSHNDLSLYRLFAKKTLMIGVLNISSLAVESAESIKERARALLSVVPPERLVLAPDCGLGMLPIEVAVQKLKNMARAAREINAEINADWREQLMTPTTPSDLLSLSMTTTTMVTIPSAASEAKPGETSMAAGGQHKPAPRRAAQSKAKAGWSKKGERRVGTPKFCDEIKLSEKVPLLGPLLQSQKCEKCESPKRISPKFGNMLTSVAA